MQVSEFIFPPLLFTYRLSRFSKILAMISLIVKILFPEKVSNSQPQLVNFLAKSYVGQGIFSGRTEGFTCLKASDKVLGFALV